MAVVVLSHRKVVVVLSSRKVVVVLSRRKVVVVLSSISRRKVVERVPSRMDPFLLEGVLSRMDPFLLEGVVVLSRKDLAAGGRGCNDLVGVLSRKDLAAGVRDCKDLVGVRDCKDLVGVLSRKDLAAGARDYKDLAAGARGCKDLAAVLWSKDPACGCMVVEIVGFLVGVCPCQNFSVGVILLLHHKVVERVPSSMDLLHRDPFYLSEGVVGVAIFVEATFLFVEVTFLLEVIFLFLEVMIFAKVPFLTRIGKELRILVPWIPLLHLCLHLFPHLHLHGLVLLLSLHLCHHRLSSSWNLPYFHPFHRHGHLFHPFRSSHRRRHDLGHGLEPSLLFLFLLSPSHQTRL